MEDMILELKEITKYYPGVKALDHVSLNVKKGEIHALVGENGAGKSTLIKTISGAITPTSGQILVNGQAFTSFTPASAREQGISVIYQEFNLVNELSVYENIYLGEYLQKGLRLDKATMKKNVADIFHRLQIQIDPSELVKNLTVGYQQLVEIARAISKNAEILIMDEPSAPLTTSEVKTMFQVVRTLQEQGVTIIYISHRMEEIFELCDRVTVMRDGCLVKTLEVKDTNNDELIKLMIGRELTNTYPERPDTQTDETVLELKNVTGNGVKDISFSLHKGEILGLGGLVGAGRTELAEMIFGMKPVEGGEILLHGKKINLKTPRDAVEHGISLIPEDRKKHGAVLDLSIRENIVMAILHRISHGMVINKKTEQKIVQEYSQALKIKTPSAEQNVKNLSGGNQQKVILAKWMATDSEVIILDEPTRGIDVGAKYEIYQIMMDLVKQGKSILMISSDMPELIGMSDRILVLAEGNLRGKLEKEEFSQEQIMKYAAN